MPAYVDCGASRQAPRPVSQNYVSSREMGQLAAYLTHLQEPRKPDFTMAGTMGVSGFGVDCFKSVTRIERFEFSGTLSGRTCKFKLETGKRDEPPSWTFLSLPSNSTVEGYILFAEDGRSAQVVETKSGKPEKYYKGFKV